MTRIFDFAPLQHSHFIIFLVVFLASFVATEALVRLRPSVWQVPHKQKEGIVYAGVPLAAIVSAAAAWVMQDVLLAIGILAASLLVICIGSIDEKKPMPAAKQFIWQVTIAAAAVAFGWTIPYVSNPVAEGIVHLDTLQFGLLVFPGSIAALLWILLCINAINWLDGVDGLAGGVVTVAFFALVAVSLLPSMQDGSTLVLALIGAAGLAGFTLWNVFPARAYLGTAGSWFIGLYIALVSMHGGGKMVTAILVLALPILDAFYVIVRRLAAGQKPWQGDRVSHLHHRLLAMGVAPRRITVLLVGITSILAVMSVIMPTSIKMISFGILGAAIVLSLVSTILVKTNKPFS